MTLEESVDTSTISSNGIAKVSIPVVLMVGLFLIFMFFLSLPDVTSVSSSSSSVGTITIVASLLVTIGVVSLGIFGAEIRCLEVTSLSTLVTGGVVCGTLTLAMGPYTILTFALGALIPGGVTSGSSSAATSASSTASASTADLVYRPVGSGLAGNFFFLKLPLDHVLGKLNGVRIVEFFHPNVSLPLLAERVVGTVKQLFHNTFLFVWEVA